ncbi:hypothetical protein D9757_012288 [Collybiopsis confluens]|uniref:Integrase catalytic domain-containing protein n=1 Tax=Collybiopsis confluens TaxID=2823264 RepID=A0A8H5GPG0_9AGAR|nr:hypothetical protein D9757_012288 [Collybiopsis confluens]
MWIIQQWAGKTYDKISTGLTEYQLHKDIISGTSLSPPPPSNVVSSALAASVPTGHHPRSTLVCYNCSCRGSGGQFEIEGYGIAHFAVCTRSGKVNSFQTAALFTPSFTMNLLSIPTFDAKRFVGAWGGGVMEVKDPKTGSVIIDGKVAISEGSRRLYEVEVLPHTLASSSALSTGVAVHAGARSLNKPCSLAMWHNRFAHINTNAVSLMKWKNLVDGLEITDSNLCGRCEVSTKDALSILEWLKNFVVKAEKQTKKKLKHFHIDLGREFDNKLFDDYAASIGVIVEKIPKDSSAANGMVERANRTVISNARTMIEDSDLGYEFWAEATSLFCYVKSMVPTSRVPGVISIQKWFPNHARINVSHLRQWGCRVIAKDLDYREGKLGCQGWKGYMVGYLDRRGYQIWDPLQRHIFSARDVVFDEGILRQTIAESAPQVNAAPIPPPVQEPGPMNENQPGPKSHIPEEQILHRDEEGIILRHSARHSIPSQALQRSHEYEVDGRRARESREEWANIVVLASTVKGADQVHIPRSFEKAMEEKEPWLPAMKKEVEFLTDRDCWELVDCPVGVRVLKGMWVYDLKVDGHGEIIARKARWVARGCHKESMGDFDRWQWKEVKSKGFLVGLSMEYFADGIAISQAPFFANAFKYFGIWDDLHPILTPLPPKYHVIPVKKLSN